MVGGKVYLLDNSCVGEVEWFEKGGVQEGYLLDRNSITCWSKISRFGTIASIKFEAVNFIWDWVGQGRRYRFGTMDTGPKVLTDLPTSLDSGSYAKSEDRNICCISH